MIRKKIRAKCCAGNLSSLPRAVAIGGALTGSRFWRENWMYTRRGVTWLTIPAWPQVSGRTAEPALGYPSQTPELAWKIPLPPACPSGGINSQRHLLGHDSEYIPIQEGSYKTRPVLVKPEQLSPLWEPYCPSLLIFSAQ